MICLSCGVLGAVLCARCSDGMRGAPDGAVGCLPLRAPYLHEGPARVLVRRLKYDGIARAAVLLAEAMAPLLPTGTEAIVPVPRSIGRRARYGVDQAVELASAVGLVAGLPVVRVLIAAPWHRPNAGMARRDRRPPTFARLRTCPPGAVLVDDVSTTGATLGAAVAAAGGGVVGAVTATRSLGRHAPRRPTRAG